MRRCILASVATIGLLVGRPAQAELVVRPGLAGAGAFSGSLMSGGVFASLPIGYDLELEPLLLMPEVVVGMGVIGGDFGAAMTRVLGGFRSGVTTVVEPSVFVRGGLAHYGVFAPFELGDSTAGPETAAGGAVQVGFGLDHRSSRDLTIGGELIYDASFFSKYRGTRTIHTVLLGVTLGFWP